MNAHQKQQVTYCKTLLSEGKTDDFLIGLGYAHAAIEAAKKELGL